MPDAASSWLQAQALQRETTLQSVRKFQKTESGCNSWTHARCRKKQPSVGGEVEVNEACFIARGKCLKGRVPQAETIVTGLLRVYAEIARGGYKPSFRNTFFTSASGSVSFIF